MHCCFAPRDTHRREDGSMERVASLRRGVALEGVTVGYNALEGIVAIAAGLAAGSVALTGFGIESVIEVTSGAKSWDLLSAAAAASRFGAHPLHGVGLLVGVALFFPGIGLKVIAVDLPESRRVDVE